MVAILAKAEFWAGVLESKGDAFDELVDLFFVPLVDEKFFDFHLVLVVLESNCHSQKPLFNIINHRENF